MFNLHGLIDKNDLAHVAKDFGEPLFCEPAPSNDPHCSRFYYKKGKKVSLFTGKPMYYLNKAREWRPMYEVSFRNAGKWIDLNENWGQIDFDYLLWLMRRCEAKGGLLTIPDGSRKLPLNVLPLARMDRFFNTTTTFTMPNTSADDAYVSCGADTVWANVRGGTAIKTLVDNNQLIIDAQIDTGDYRAYHSYVRFTTGTLSDTDTIDSWKVQIAGDGSTTYNADTTSAHVVVGTQASPVVNTDFTAVSYTSKGSIALSSWVNTLGTYNDINGTDITVINKTADTLFALMNSRDLDNSAPTGTNQVRGRSSNATDYNPKLNVVHTAASTFIPKIIMS